MTLNDLFQNPKYRKARSTLVFLMIVLSYCGYDLHNSVSWEKQKARFLQANGDTYLIPAECIGAKDVDYIVGPGKRIGHKGTTETCFYSAGSFKRLFPQQISGSNENVHWFQSQRMRIQLEGPSTHGGYYFPLFMMASVTVICGLAFRRWIKEAQLGEGAGA